MLERLELKNKPDENLVMEFLNRAPAELADSILVRSTEHAMYERLKAKRDDGFSGWNTPQIDNAELLTRLKTSLEMGAYIDVINFAAMLLSRENMFVEKHHGKQLI